MVARHRQAEGEEQQAKQEQRRRPPKEKRQRLKTAQGEAAGNSDAEMKDGSKKPPQQRKNRVRRGGGRQARDGNRQITTKDPKLRELLTVICKQLTNNTMRTRQLLGMAVTTFLLDSKGTIVKALATEGANFDRTAQGNREKKKQGEECKPLGPPTVGNFMVFLLSVVGLEIGGKNKTDLQAVLDKYALQEAIPEDLGNIGMFRLESTMKEEQTKLLIGFGGWPHKQLIENSMRQAGHEPLQGAWIEALEQGTTVRALICALTFLEQIPS